MYHECLHWPARDYCAGTFEPGLATFGHDVCGNAINTHLVFFSPVSFQTFVPFPGGPIREHFPVSDVCKTGDTHSAGRLHKIKRDVENLSSTRQGPEQREEGIPLEVALVDDLGGAI